MDHTALIAHVHRQFTPVDLRLLARLRLEAGLRQAVQGGLGPQRSHSQLDGLITARKAQLTQFLMKYARGVMNLRGALLEPIGKVVQNGWRLHSTGVGRPLRLLQTSPNGLAVDVQLARDGRDRSPGFAAFMNGLPHGLIDLGLSI